MKGEAESNIWQYLCLALAGLGLVLRVLDIHFAAGACRLLSFAITACASTMVVTPLGALLWGAMAACVPSFPADSQGSGKRRGSSTVEDASYDGAQGLTGVVSTVSTLQALVHGEVKRDDTFGVGNIDQESASLLAIEDGRCLELQTKGDGA